MISKKYIIISCTALIIFLLAFLWENALVIDDFHPGEASAKVSYIEQEDGNGKGSPIGTSIQNENKVKKGCHIHINLDLHFMYVYKNDELIRTYPVSGGKPSTPSPIGTWKIISKDTWGEGFGGAWLGFNVPWGQYGIHGTLEPWFIGKSNSSKGCIRMKNNDVRELYKLVPHGTIVTIAHENRPFYPMRSGDVGSDVLDVQRALSKLGYYRGGVDGKFGNGLKAGVQKFQKDNRLYSTGVVNKSTYVLIKQKIKQLEEL